MKTTREIKHTEECLTDAMGISDERAKNLCAMVTKAHFQSNKESETLVAIIEGSETPEELVWSMNTLNSLRNVMTDPLEMLSKIMQSRHG